MPDSTPTSTDADARIIRIDTRQQLLAAGHDDESIKAAVRAGSLSAARRAAYVEGAAWTGFSPADRHVVGARAAQLQSRTPTVLSHTSAAMVWGAPDWGQDLGRAHLTRVDRRAGRRTRDLVQHRGTLGPEDVADVDGLLVTTPTRTALDVLRLTSQVAGLVLVNDLLHRGLTTEEALRERYEGGGPADLPPMKGWPRSLGTEVVLHLADGRLESVGETRLFHAMWKEHVPVPVPQHPVFDAFGRVLYRLDFAWPDLGAWIEFDGMSKYLAHEDARSTRRVFLDERRREQHIVELTGWRCLRLEWRDLEDPARCARRILAFLAQSGLAA